MVSIDGDPLALPATSKGTTEQHEDTTEQHEHHFLDPSCRICMGGRETQEGHRGGGQAGAECGVQRQRGFMAWGEGGGAGVPVFQVTSKRTWFKLHF